MKHQESRPLKTLVLNVVIVLGWTIQLLLCQKGYSSTYEVLKLPNGPLIKEAYAELRPRFMRSPEGQRQWNHQIRTFLLGRSYVIRNGLEEGFDEEGYFLACLFHDLGAFEEYDRETETFEEYNSRRLGEFLTRKRDKSFPAEELFNYKRITKAQDAIYFHTQIVPINNRGPMVQALQRGAWTDFTQIPSIYGIDREDFEDIQEAYPSTNFTDEFLKNIIGNKLQEISVRCKKDISLIEWRDLFDWSDCGTYLFDTFLENYDFLSK